MSTSKLMTRVATHAGSWYSSKASKLKEELESYLSQSKIQDLPGCRAVIVPHAGYAYSAGTAALSFAALQKNGIKRVFILGPSHHKYMTHCAVSSVTEIETPLGLLSVDTQTVGDLMKDDLFHSLDKRSDEQEHSIEMQMPFIKLAFDDSIKVIPIMVGSISKHKEEQYASALLPYFSDPENVFVISSDFAHWGLRFRYTAYLDTKNKLHSLRLGSQHLIDPQKPIFKSIEEIDRQGIDIIQTKDLEKFHSYLNSTENTICGRHPIGILLAMLERIDKKTNIQCLGYKQSSQVTDIDDSSVSYVSCAISL